ncbi:MAG: phosphoribosylformimino-5-aminoimidazole carboxamide ribotide isomerase [Sphingobacteriales bacterium]|jgi:phosphoribosylformimino-5-aminoimidazole carboxamide ribotide isomerase
MEGVVPALDLINGQVVRLQKGDYNKVKVYGNPVDLAMQLEDQGYERLHLVDLDGAKAGMVQHVSVLKEIREKTKLRIDFGGGITSKDALDKVLNAGANWATVGSIAVQEPTELLEWISEYGASSFLLGIDVRQEKVAISGWINQTEIVWSTLMQQWVNEGVQDFFMTDINKDGMDQGPSFGLYKKVLDQFPQVNLLASGGIRHASDVEECLALGLRGAIVGKAVLEGKIGKGLQYGTN